MKTRSLLFSVITLSALALNSCSKGSGGGGGGGNTDPCSGKTITVSATASVATFGLSDASITVSASGSTGFTYSLNGNPYQSSNIFSGLPKGNFTISVKDGGGCIKTTTVTITENDPCLTQTFTVSASTTGTNPCSPGGSIAVAVTGPGSFQYSLNSGPFQSSNVFNGLAAGNYTIRVQEAGGCVKTANGSVSILPNGTLFAAVRNLISSNCSSCHTASNPNGGINFDTDCSIVNNRTRIKARAVDASPSAMPPSGLLPASERAKITNWINAGGQTTN